MQKLKYLLVSVLAGTTFAAMPVLASADTVDPNTTCTTHIAQEYVQVDPFWTASRTVTFTPHGTCTYIDVSYTTARLFLGSPPITTVLARVDFMNIDGSYCCSTGTVGVDGTGTPTKFRLDSGLNSLHYYRVAFVVGSGIGSPGVFTTKVTD